MTLIFKKIIIKTVKGDSKEKEIEVMKTREYYYGAEAFGAEWEEMKKNILAEMREKYKNCIVQDVDYLEHMPFDRDGHHATGYEVKIDGFWDYDYEE